MQVCPGEDAMLHANIVCPVNVTKQPEHTLPDMQITSEALRVLEQLNAESQINVESRQPFLLAVGLHKPHIPLKFPESFRGTFRVS